MKAKHLIVPFILPTMALTACGLFQPQIVEVPVTVVVEPTRLPNTEAADLAGDALLPGVDILSSSATVFPSGPNLWVDLRLKFAAMPFGAEGHQIVWCLNTDQNAASGGACDSDTPVGTDWRLVLKGGRNALTTKDFSFDLVNRTGLFACHHGSFDWTTNTLRILLPLSLFSDNGNFNYAVLSASGNNSASDMAPDVINFSSSGGYFQSQVISQPLPFNNGVPLCGLQS